MHYTSFIWASLVVCHPPRCTVVKRCKLEDACCRIFSMPAGRHCLPSTLFQGRSSWHRDATPFECSVVWWVTRHDYPPLQGGWVPTALRHLLSSWEDCAVGGKTLDRSSRNFHVLWPRWLCSPYCPKSYQTYIALSAWRFHSLSIVLSPGEQSYQSCCPCRCSQQGLQPVRLHMSQKGLSSELYSRSKLILSSQIRSDNFDELEKRSRSSSQAYLSLIFPSRSQWSDVSLSSWQVHRETKIPLLEGRSTKSFCILLPSF